MYLSRSFSSNLLISAKFCKNPAYLLRFAKIENLGEIQFRLSLMKILFAMNIG